MFGEGVRGRELHVRPYTQQPSIQLPLASVGPTNILRADAVQDKPLEEKNSNTTIRPPSMLIPEFHHGVPTSISNNHHPPMTPPKTGALQDYTSFTKPSGSYEHEYLASSRSRSPSPNEQSDDLSDYLSHSISFDQLDEQYVQTKRGG